MTLLIAKLVSEIERYNKRVVMQDKIELRI